MACLILTLKVRRRSSGIAFLTFSIAWFFDMERFLLACVAFSAESVPMGQQPQLARPHRIECRYFA